MPLNGRSIKPLSLYFHIPFCTKKCPYCHFYVIKDDALLKKRFLEALRKEWEQKKHLLEGHEIISVYFGGGTPSLLSASDFETIFSFLKVPKTCEITVEANPESVSLSFMQSLNQLGVNRISLGVQSFDNSLLKKIGRTHNAEKALQAICDINKAGIDNISIDLMYDLPEQTIEIFEHTLETAVQQPITHISLYNLTIEPNTFFYRKKKQLQKTIPKEEESTTMLNNALSTFEKNSFVRYEISAFAKKGFHSRHNSGYWLGRSFLGFGPSAFSFFNKSRFSNINHFMTYEKSLNEGVWPTGFSETLSDEALFKELLAIRLRLLAFPISYPSFPSSTIPSLQKLVKQGYICQKEGAISLTEKGALFYDSVAEELIDESTSQ